MEVSQLILPGEPECNKNGNLDLLVGSSVSPGCRDLTIDECGGPANTASIRRRTAWGDYHREQRPQRTEANSVRTKRVHVNNVIGPGVPLFLAVGPLRCAVANQRTRYNQKTPPLAFFVIFEFFVVNPLGHK